MERHNVSAALVWASVACAVSCVQALGTPDSQPGHADGATTSEGPISLTTNESKKPPSPRIVPYVDYGGDLWDRPALSGDWGGVRQKLMDKGIRFNLNITQTYQGNVAGGTLRRGYYQGGVRYELALDTGYMGLWPGGMLMMRGETQYGNTDNFSTGALMPVNTDALYPVPSGDQTALTEIYYMQFVAPQLGFLAGRMSLRLNTPFTGDETTQFMNTALVFPPIMGTTFPLVTTAAGAITIPAKWLTVTTLVLDSEGNGTLSGFDPDTVFAGGTTVFQQAQFTIKPFGRTGHQNLIWTWSDRQRVAFQQSAFAIIGNIRQGITPVLTRSSDDWTVVHAFDQYLYNPPGKPDEGIGVFGYYGVGPGVVNPIRANYCIGVGGKGMIPTRSKDTYGIGYYFLDLSDKLPQVLRSRTDNEQGVEIYYNFEVAPWLHITPDLQIIDPARSIVDCDWVLGLRVRMDL